MLNVQLERRHVVRIMALAVVCCMAYPAQTVFAQQKDAHFEFRPHCETDTDCPSFDIRDPQSLQTQQLKPGDLLDLDLIIVNPDKKPIKRFRAWVAYDPTLLQGEKVDIADTFPTPTPGETDFVASEGYVKISGTATEPASDELIVAARIRFTVINVRDTGTPLTYYDRSETEEAETGIFSEVGSQETNIITRNPGYLFVRMSIPETASSMSSSGMTATGSSVSSISPDASSGSFSSAVSSSASVFTMLQVQGVRITTEGSTVFLAWDALPSTELVGYNVYYGTVSGKYIQRRGIDKTATSLTIRTLPVGTTYYFALRGVNAQSQETEFSQEVGVSVGNPKTSTSPLIGNSISPDTPKTNGNITGDTGIPTSLALFVILSAVIGTFLAFRRQLGANLMSHD